MLDIPSVSAIVATIGVIVGVVFTVLQLRDLVKTRQTDLVFRLYSAFGSKEFLETFENVRTTEFKDYNEYVQKYGWLEVIEIGTLFEGIGILLNRKLIDIGLVGALFSEPINMVWQRMKPMIDADRKQLNQPRIFEWFERLRFP